MYCQNLGGGGEFFGKIKNTTANFQCRQSNIHVIVYACKYSGNSDQEKEWKTNNTCAITYDVKKTSK